MTLPLAPHQLNPPHSALIAVYGKSLVCNQHITIKQSSAIFSHQQFPSYHTTIKIQLGELTILMREECQILEGIC
jgi:hypothetical protein